MLHVLQVLLLPPAHGAQVEGAAAVEARQGGQVGAVKGVLCKHTRERGGLEAAGWDADADFNCEFWVIFDHSALCWQTAVTAQRTGGRSVHVTYLGYS